MYGISEMNCRVFFVEKCDMPEVSVIIMWNFRLAYVVSLVSKEVVYSLHTRLQVNKREVRVGLATFLP